MVFLFPIASTIHDPKGQLETMITDNSKILAEYSKQLTVTLSPNTSNSINYSLKNLGITTFRSKTHFQGLYSEALKTVFNQKNGKLFYCDFDRLLHWISRYPTEFESLNKHLKMYDFLVLGRTKRAFQTHPPTQKITENILNELISRILNLNETCDFFATCFALTNTNFNSILTLKPTNTFGFYAEWPIVAWKNSVKPGYLEVEGLEWETPNRFQKEIGKMGYLKWFNQFQTPNEWKRRVKVMADCVNSISKYITN